LIFFHFVMGLGTYRSDYGWHIEAAHSNAEPHCSSASRRLTCNRSEEVGIARPRGRSNLAIVPIELVLGVFTGKSDL
jgi:hypothetical protein